MTLLEKLRLGYLARARREKLLTVLFLVVVAGLWLTLFVDRVQAFGPELTQIKDTAENQNNVLNDRERIETRYASAFATLSGTDRPSGQDAYATIDQIVRSFNQATGCNISIDRLSSERRDQLTFYPIGFSVFKADFFKLAGLFNDVIARVPTVNLSEVVISVPDKSNPMLLDARFKFVAIEINH
jgi:hypothetical protein